eukprot:SAG22_NODE_306_length_12671_cov_14.743239_3_plen_128_part_00
MCLRHTCVAEMTPDQSMLRSRSAPASGPGGCSGSAGAVSITGRKTWASSRPPRLEFWCRPPAQGLRGPPACTGQFESRTGAVPPGGWVAGRRGGAAIGASAVNTGNITSFFKGEYGHVHYFTQPFVF